jgi:hypothetical protein
MSADTYESSEPNCAAHRFACLLYAFTLNPPYDGSVGDDLPDDDEHSILRHGIADTLSSAEYPDMAVHVRVDERARLGTRDKRTQRRTCGDRGCGCEKPPSMHVPIMAQKEFPRRVCNRLDSPVSRAPHSRAR